MALYSRTLLSALALLAAGVCHASLISLTNNAGGAIPDNNVAGATFTANIVSDEIVALAGNGNVILTLTGISHSWIGDLSFVLSHVDTGTSVIIFDRPGVPDFSSIGYRGKLNGNYTFGTGFTDDFEEASAAAHATNSAVPSGNYKPEGNLNAFAGEAAAGTWALKATDKASGTVANTTWTWNLSIQGVTVSGGGGSGSGTPTGDAPEPVSCLLVGGGLIALGLRRRHKTVESSRRSA